MTDSRPLPTGEPLLAGVAHEVDDHHAEGIQLPTEDGPREVDYDLPIVISSDEEEDSVVIVIEDEDDEEDDRSDEEEESEEEDWTSEDSGYDTLSEEEEDLEDDDVNIGRLSPLIQEFPPEEFWHGWRQEFSPVPADVAHPHVPEERLPPVLPLAASPCSSVAEPSRPEDPAASTSGHSSSTKRSREESHSEQVSDKRPRWDIEGSLQESAPSTSGLSSSTKRSREESHSEQVSDKRHRWDVDGSPQESAPSTSGLSSSAPRRPWLSRADCPSWFDDSDSN